MAINTFHFKLDIEREDYIPKFRLKQYDTAIFYASLYKNGLPYHFENEQIKMFVKKSDGTIVYQEDNISIQDDEVKINVNNQVFTCAGLTYAELEFKSSDGQVTSSTFLYEVKEKVGSDKAIESVTDIATLDKLKRYMEDAKKELEKFKNDFSKIEDLVANKDKLEGQNKEAKENIVELGKVLEDANNITSDEGKYIVGNNIISESTNGYIQDLKLYGKSLVNRFRFRSQGVANTNIYVYSNESVNDNTTGGNTLRIFNNTNKKVIFDINSNGVYKRSEILGSYEKYRDITLLTDEYLYCIYGQTKDGWNSELESDRKLLKNSCIAVDDFTVKNIDTYFEGISSVGNGYEIEVLSTSKNLVTEVVMGGITESGELTDNPINNRTSKCTIKPNTQYVFSKNGALRNCNKFYYDYNGNCIGQDFINNTNPIFTTPHNAYYVVLTWGTTLEEGKYQLEVGDKITDFVKPKQDKKTILFKDADGNWKPVTELCGCWENGNFIWGDTIELHSDGKYYLHIRTKTAKGTDLIGLVKEQNFPNRDGYYGFLPNKEGIKLAVPDKLKPYIICDKLKSVGIDIIAGSQYSDVDCISYDTRYKCVRLSVPKGTGINTYLSEKNITFILPIDEKVYECLDISTRAFRNKTMLSIYSGAMDPGISYYVPTGFLSADNSISEKVETLDKYSEKNTKDINDLTSNIENNYFNINRGLLTDFNNGTQEGKYYLHSSSLIPNSPPTSTTGLYGIVEVLYKNENELFQFVTLHSGESWLRFRNGHGDWDKWHKLVTQDDFPSNIDSQGTGYQYLPNGMLMQWGTTTVTFDSVKGSAIIRYPVTYKAYCKCTGNLESNDYGSYSETNAVVGGQTLSQGFCEVRDINGSSRAGKIARVTWIVIGR